MRVICLFICVFFMCVTACKSKSPDYFLSEGRAINTQILEQVQDIDDLEALIQALPLLQSHFNQLVDLMIEAKKWQVKYKTTWEPSQEDIIISQELQAQFSRLYTMPSARALIEKAQESALIRLDTFDKKRP